MTYTWKDFEGKKRSKTLYHIVKVIQENGPITGKEIREKLSSRYYNTPTPNQLGNIMAKHPEFFEKVGFTSASSIIRESSSGAKVAIWGVVPKQRGA